MIARNALRSRWFGVGLFVAAMVFQAVVMRRQITYYDEQLEIYCAEHVLHGQVPYRDFWTMYGPAQFYVLAGFLKVFGVSVLTGRFYDALIKAGIACACFALVERLADRRWAVGAFAAALLCLTCNVSPIYNFPIFPALLCGLGSVLFLSRFLEETGKIWRLRVAGLLTGLATLFRHDSGFYICIAVCITLRFAARVQGLAKPRVRLVRVLRAYLACVLAVTLPVLAWVLWKVPMHDLYYNLIYVPGAVYPKVRSLPFPGLASLRPYLHPVGRSTLYALEGFVVYLPIAVWATAALSLFGRSRRFEQAWQRLTFGALVLLNALLFIKGLVRVTELHFMQVTAVSAALTLVLLARRAGMGVLLRIAVQACGILVGGYLGLLVWHASTYARWNVRDAVRPEYHYSIYKTCHPPAGLERARCLDVDASTVAAVQYVQRLTTPAEPIYVGAGRHDKLAMNDVRFYVLAGRTSVTRWYDLHPGVQTTLPIQDEMVASVRQQRPKAIVLNDAWDDVDEPNASRVSSGVTVLDEYIRGHYVKSASFGSYAVLVPRDQAADSDSK